ncbi:cysteine hydrolase family protein, partial [Neorhizobium galegae]|uniref:cysteine hydrolase family protein n=1 Tax=Neorhizobium galegae TaxID=399 RepID=UPI0021070D13
MGQIKAEPFAFPAKPEALALIVIDMQRDFAEPGGFGASLGNDVGRITKIVPDVKRLIQGFRDAGLPVIHTMECHKPDLSDLPPAKRDRGNPTLRIGDVGPMGRVLIDGEHGQGNLSSLTAIEGEVGLEMHGQGAIW